MTQEEVELILGKPSKKHWWNVWKQKSFTIRIGYFSDDEGRRIARRGYLEADDGTEIHLRERPPTFIEHIREFVGF